MNSKEAVIQLLSDRPIAYHPIIARLLDGVEEAVFLSQLLYWTGKGKLDGGWIFKADEEMRAETGLSHKNQQTARRKLVKLGVLQEKLAGVPATLHYKIDLDRLYDLLIAYQNLISQFGRNGQSSLTVSAKLDSPIRPNLFDQIGQTIPETTRDDTEITPAPLPKDGNGGMSLSQSELPDVQTQVGILFAGSSATIRQAELDIKRASWRISSDDLRLAAAHFMTASGLDVPYDKNRRKGWLAGLREHLDTFGLDFIKKNYPKVVMDMRSKNLSVVQPQSVTSFLLDLKARSKSPANIITENGKKVRVVK